VQEYSTNFKNIDIMLKLSEMNVDVLLKYLGSLHRHMREKVILFKPKSTDEAYVQTQYLENIGIKRVESSGSEQKEL